MGTSLTVVRSGGRRSRIPRGLRSRHRAGPAPGGRGPKIGRNEPCYADCVRRIDCFNNGGTFDGITGECVIEEGNCHERPLCDSPDPNLCFDPEGPASSWRDCRDARRNDCTIDGC